MARRVDKITTHLTAATNSGDVTENAQNKAVSNPYLAGNFRPTSTEGHYGALRVAKGEAPPAWLQGQFLRVGPNPKFDFTGKPYHSFDGDGFVHAVGFRDGVASYTKRFVRTHRLVTSEQRGFDVSEIGMMSTGDFSYPPHVTDKIKPNLAPAVARMGKANTNLVAHAGRVLALEEADVPYEIVVSHDGDSNLRTVGRFDWQGRLEHAMTAHPKVDPVTGELVFFAYELMEAKCHYAVVDKNGALVRDFEVPLPCGVMMHDFVIAGEYSILFDQRLEFRLERVGEGKNPWVHRMDLPARFGVLPRLATSADAIKWIDVAPCSLFHFANAWVEKDGTIVVVGSRLHYADFMPDMEVVNKPLGAKDTRGRLYEWRLDPRGTGRCVSERQLFDVANDFPQVDATRTGLKTRFVYATRFVTDRARLPRVEYAGNFAIDAIVKYDLATGACTELPLTTSSGAQAYGGEAVFAPNPARKAGEEDNGVLVVYAHDETTERTQCLLIDARDMRVLTWIDVPERVPYGFHSLWVDEAYVR